MNINVLYEDNHLLVVEKPVNVPVQADSSGDPDLLSALKGYIRKKYAKPGEAYLGLVHRLDRPVGGVMVFARTSKAASRLSSQFLGHGAKKRYAALVLGRPKPFERLADHLVRDEATGFSHVAPPEDSAAKSASLTYGRLCSDEALDGFPARPVLLDIDLHSGRHHQIRVQLAAHDMPILGDQRYNPRAVPGEQIALWAYALTIEHPTRREPITFTSAPRGPLWGPFSDELRALAAGVELVYNDPDILIAAKPANLTVANADGGEDTLEARLASVFPSVFPVHRLDAMTRGLVLFARNPLARDALDEAMRLRTIGKFYRCFVQGIPAPAEATLRSWLVKDSDAARVRVLDSPSAGALEIITRYRLLRAEKGRSLLEVELVTGRTHQIRAHLSHIGHPILGDDLYGERAANRASGADLALAAVRLTLNFPEGSYLARLDGRSVSYPIFT